MILKTLILAASVTLETITGPKQRPDVHLEVAVRPDVEAVIAQEDDPNIRLPTNIVILKPKAGQIPGRYFASEYIVMDGTRKVGYGRAKRVDTGDDGVLQFSELDASRLGHTVRGIKYEPGFPWCFHGTRIICTDGEFVTDPATNALKRAER